MNCGTNPMIRVVCPEPRRVNCNSEWVMKLPLSNKAEGLDSKVGEEVFLDLILKEDGIAGMPSASLLSSSPPFFNGSPPSRAMNPLIHDVYFGNYGKQLTGLLSSSSSSTSASPSPSSSRKGRSCARARLLGQITQAPARVEGFDCQNSPLVAMSLNLPK